MTNFSEISAKYEDTSLVQKSASDQLFDLIQIKEGDDVLDIGCGTGNLTKKIMGKTKGNVAGIDASKGMIEKAIQNYSHLGIRFDQCPIEQMTHADSFDVIFCNSTFQWFTNPEPVLQACHNALRPNGRMGIQAPARKIYSPNFIEAVEKVKYDPRLKEQFASFQAPWFFLETPEEYNVLFEKAGFEILHSRIDRVVSFHTPEEVYKIFESGASAGYLNQKFYSAPLSEAYSNTFRQIVKEAFRDQTNSDGQIDLIFFRIYLLARKLHKRL